MTDVFIVLKNSDFTEGRGPMYFHSVWDTLEAATKYVMGQPGIFGSQQEKTYLGNKRERTWVYNGYDIIQSPLKTAEDALTPEQVAEIRSLLVTKKAEIEALEAKLK